MAKAGTWKFIDKATSKQTLIKVSEGSASKVKTAFDAAKTALSPSSDNTLFGYDPDGREYRYTSITLGKKFNR